MRGHLLDDACTPTSIFAGGPVAAVVACGVACSGGNRAAPANGIADEGSPGPTLSAIAGLGDWNIPRGV